MGVARTFRQGVNGSGAYTKKIPVGNRTADIGATGLQENWGQIQDDFLTEWRGPEKVKRVTEVLKNSPGVGAMRFAMEMQMRNADWYVNSRSGGNERAVALVQDSMENMSYSWDDHIIDAMLMFWYGWEKSSIIYERVGSRILWRKLKMLGHDTVQRWLIAPDGGIVGLQQWPHLWPDPISIERLILYRTRKTQNNPEGESFLRPAWIPWYYIKNLQQIEAIGIERNLAGMPVLQPPMGADMSQGSDDRTTAEKILRNVRQDEQAGLLLPPPKGPEDHQQWKFWLASPEGTGKALEIGQTISRHEKRLLMSTLSQFLMLGMDNVGAMATFDGATDFFTAGVNAGADIIAETFTKHAIPRLLRLNGLNDAIDDVILEHSPVGETGLDVLIELLSKAGPFITFTAEDEVMIRSRFQLPEKSVEELEQLREEEQARKDAMAQAMQRGFQQGQVDENAATWYTADRNPHDDQLRRLEDRFYDGALTYFGRQKRALRAAVREANPE